MLISIEAPDQLTEEEFATFLRWKHDLFKLRRSRGQVPSPESGTYKTPLWARDTVAAYAAAVARGCYAKAFIYQQKPPHEQAKTKEKAGRPRPVGEP